MSIESSKPLPNVSEGFRIVNEREGNDFAFIHDANEIKFEIARFVRASLSAMLLNLNFSIDRNCNYSAVGDIFAEQPYAIAVQQGSHLQVFLSYQSTKLYRVLSRALQFKLKALPIT